MPTSKHQPRIAAASSSGSSPQAQQPPSTQIPATHTASLDQQDRLTGSSSDTRIRPSHQGAQRRQSPPKNARRSRTRQTQARGVGTTSKPRPPPPASPMARIEPSTGESPKEPPSQPITAITPSPEITSALTMLHDYMHWANPQTLVDSSFLALEPNPRLPKPPSSKNSTQRPAGLAEHSSPNAKYKPQFNNWLLLSRHQTKRFLMTRKPSLDRMRVDYAIRELQSWYRRRHLRDGQKIPLGLLQKLRHQPYLLNSWTPSATNPSWSAMSTPYISEQRYAPFQERTHRPDGLYPPIGRSITYVAARSISATIIPPSKLPQKSHPHKSASPVSRHDTAPSARRKTFRATCCR